MNFIEVTDKEADGVVYSFNPEHIVCVFVDVKGNTWILPTHGQPVVVKEEYADILEEILQS